MILVPDEFKRLMLERTAQDGEEWLARLSDILERSAQRWQLRIQPAFPNLSYHYVAPVTRADGTTAVLKIFTPTDAIEKAFARSVEVMHLYNGQGIVRMLEYDTQDEAMLMEHVKPGTVLSQLVPERDEEANSHYASVLRQMLRPAPQTHQLLTVEDEAKDLAKLRPYYGGTTGPFPPALVDLAESLFRELGASTTERTLLHGDLHHDNILFSREHGWRAIDAKGMTGDAAYEPSTMIYQPQSMNATNPRRLLERRLDQLAEELGLERARLHGWALAKSVLSTWWDVDGQGYISPFGAIVLECSKILAQIKA